MVTKAEILNGIKVPEEYEVKALRQKVWLRRLTSAELDESSYIEAKGFGNIDQNTRSKAQNIQTADVNQNNKINLEKVTKAQDDAKYYIIQKSLDNPKYESDPWTLDEIKMLPIDATDELLQIVREISGVNVTKEEVKKFPEDNSG